jgi:hypothetical protein
VKKRCFKGIKTCDKKAIILFWAIMPIEKHLIVAYVTCTKWRNQLENVTPTGSNDRNSICFQRPDWILKSQLNDWVEICRVTSFCEMIFAHLSKVFIVVYRFNCMNSFNLYKFSGIFKYFDISKTYEVTPCVCPLIDHGSRPMKSHEFLRLLYKIIWTELLFILPPLK